jgi:hypothetical protein
MRAAVVTRTERDEAVLRAACKVAIVSHAIFAVIAPILMGEANSYVWRTVYHLSPWVVIAWATLSAAAVLAGIIWRAMRAIGGASYAIFALTYGLFSADWRVGAYAVAVAVVAVLLAWTGIPEK